MQPHGGLPLVVRVLGGQAEYVCTEGLELSGEVPESTRLRGAAAGSGDLVPAGRRVNAGAADTWVVEDHQPAVSAQLAQIDRAAGRGGQRQLSTDPGR